MQSSQEYSLSSKTLVFWKLSQVWNGKRAVEVSTGDAIEICTTLCEMLGPQRPLYRGMNNLLREIIEGQGIKAPETKVLPFAKPAKTRKVRS